MTVASDCDTDVLVVGAGPTGLVLALWLARLGVRVRIVERAPQPGTTSRAVAVQARTLEFYEQIGLAEAVVARGRTAVAANIWVAGKRAARAVFGALGAGLSPFPYALLLAQDEHERLLAERLSQAGVEIERGTALLDFEDRGGLVRARLGHADGGVSECRAAYLAGCDGAHSTVREALGIGFPGGTYAHLFYVADVEGNGPALNGEIHVGLDASDFVAVFPLKGEGRARLVGTVQADAQDRHDTLSWNDVSARVIAWMNIAVARVSWFSTYRVHHRVAGRFREGRAFLLGDAAHIHSPVGGQGMNTGIGDAVNLAWKLADVLNGRANAALLDSYEPERLAFARRLVATTDRAFTLVTSPGAIARALRLHVVPLLLPALFSFKAVRRFLFRTVSQTAVNYRHSRLSVGRVGAVAGGDRLPWIGPGGNAGDPDNFAPLVSLDWQVHVYGDVDGEAGAELATLCEARKLPLHVFAWRPAMARSGLARDALYLVRPDGYVALAHATAGATACAPAIASYLDARAIALAAAPRPESASGVRHVNLNVAPPVPGFSQLP